ncbi:MAG: SH3 domain-containing protein [Candidatus Omnitrophota bacterium]|nr:SH3 domain-containing protein [Candidatus Omnitrophota bacterium]MDZ4241672.1 SH3 domain-containing protein [Candidatus Omnitrophota bacterium]
MKKIPGIFAVLALLLLSVCGLRGVAAAGPGGKADEALTLFVKAGMAYKDGHYDQAAVYYEEIVRKGLESGPVYYNLANCYFKKGALGKAVLNYERAGKLIPRDQDLKANHEYALSLLDVPSIPATGAEWREKIAGALALLTDEEMILLALAFAFLAAVLHLLSLQRGGGRGLPVLFCCLALLFSAGFAVSAGGGRDNALAVAKTSARFEPREEATVHFEVPEGQRIKVLRAEGAWTKIERADGKAGWVPSPAVEKI